MRLLPELAVPLQADIGIGAQLVDNPYLQSRQLHRRTPRNGLGFDMAHLAVLFEIALDGGKRHPEHFDNLRSWVALLDCIHDSFAQIF